MGHGPGGACAGQLARPAHESLSLSISQLGKLRAHPEANFRKFENSGSYWITSRVFRVDGT